MKTLLSYLAITAFVLMSSFTLNQQHQLNEKRSVDNCFASFRTHREGKAGVTLNWSVSSSEISRFIVERSYDGEFFEPVTSINFNGTATYKYKDSGVYPGMIYYRITAIKADETTETSSVSMVRIVQHG